MTYLDTNGVNGDAFALEPLHGLKKVLRHYSEKQVRYSFGANNSHGTSKILTVISVLAQEVSAIDLAAVFHPSRLSGGHVRRVIIVRHKSVKPWIKDLPVTMARYVFSDTG